MWYPLYHIRFVDDTQGAWLVEVQGTEAPAGPVVEIEAGDSPLTWMGDGKASQTETLLGATGNLGLYITDETLPHITMGKLLPDGALSRRVVVKREGVTVWMGFIQSQTFNQAWESTPFSVDLALMDTVDALKYVYVDANESARNILDMLYSAYQKVGGEKTRRDFIRTNVQRYTPRPGFGVSASSWGTGEVFPEFWNGDPNKKKSYADALETILSPHGRLFQTGTAWFVGRDDITSARLYRPADAGGGQLTPNETDAATADISYAVAGSNNNQAQLPPPSKVTQNYSPDSGVVDIGGDDIFKFSEEIITGTTVTKVETDQWPRETGKLLRYLFLADVAGKFTRRTFTRYVRAVAPMWISETWDTNEKTSSGWAQVLGRESISSLNYTVQEVLAICGYREFTKYEASERIFRYSVDEIVINTPVYTDKTNVLHLQGGATLSDLSTSATVEDEAWQRKTFASVIVYFGTKPGERLMCHTDYGWKSVNEVAIYSPEHDLNDLKGEFYVGLPSGYQTGYITLELCAGSRYAVNMGYEHWDKLNGRVVIKDVTLSYSPNVNDPKIPLQWNKEGANTTTDTVDGGMNDLDLSFKTLAGAEPEASDFFSPRRGFDDGDAYVKAPREMVDIDAVQVTQDGDIPGVTRFSLFTFDGKTYFPAAVGMNARENTVRLKLIRTL